MALENADVASALPGYLSALLAGEREAAVEAALQPVVAGADVLDVHLHVLQPALHLIGRHWERGEITVAAEHLATTITPVSYTHLDVYKRQVWPSSSCRSRDSCMRRVSNSSSW